MFLGFGKRQAFSAALKLIIEKEFLPFQSNYCFNKCCFKAFEQALKERKQDPYIDVTFFHSQTLAEELKRNADSLLPRFVFAFTILVLFSVACNILLIDGTFYIDWILSKPILAVLGVINAGMGILTAMGFLNLVGCPYTDIIGVMPFLVVGKWRAIDAARIACLNARLAAVGTDNMFLMVAAIRRTNRAHSPQQRLG